MWTEQCRGFIEKLYTRVKSKRFSNEISLLIYISLWLSIAAILFLQASSNSWSGIVARSTSTIHIYNYNQSVVACFVEQWRTLNRLQLVLVAHNIEKLYTRVCSSHAVRRHNQEWSKKILKDTSRVLCTYVVVLKVKVKVKVWTLAIAPLIWVRLVTNSALQSRKWQLIGMSQCCRSALCGHPLPALTDNWTHGAAGRHTMAPISHTRPSPRSRSYYSFSVPLRVGGWVGLSTQ